MPYQHIMDDQRVNETMRILTYYEAKTGVSAAIGVPADYWEKSFGKYVEDHKDAKLIFCWYTRYLRSNQRC
jgi:hypothetical protein